MMHDWIEHLDFIGHGLGGITMWLIPILLLVIGIYFLYQYNKKTNSESNDNPLDIIKKRYAKGEISKEEFETMKQELK